MDTATINYYSQNASEVAARYESVVSNLSARFAESFKPKSKILDIGCGSGRDLALLSTLGHRCFGIDATPQFVELAQKLHPELQGHISVAALPNFDPPFGGEFDGILCSAVLMHLPVHELVDAAKSIKRCLRPGGRLLFSVPSKRADVVSAERDTHGRLFVSNQSDRLRSILEDFGFREIAAWADADSLGRDGVKWTSVLMEADYSR